MTTLLQQPDPMLDAMAAEEAAAAQAQQQAQEVLQEEADVGEWLKRIEAGRKKDKGAREGYAKDRLYCTNRQDADVYGVRVPIAGTYVHLLNGYLYARNPEPSVEPDDALEGEDKEAAKQFAHGLDIYLTRTWRKSKLKLAMDSVVRSGNTVAIGWLKSAWHRQTGHNPQTQQQIQTLQQQLAALDAQAARLADGQQVANLDAERAEHQRRLAALQAQANRTLFNGSVKDFVRAEDIQVAPECPSLRNYLDSPWIAHRIFKRLDKAKEEHQHVEDQLQSATFYSCNDPAAPGDGEGVQYSKDSAGAAGDDSTRYVCLWEVWDKTTGHVLTVAEGCKRYVIRPYQPQQRTTRFYPFFQWAPIWNDGERHPQSLVDLSRDLLDEYNRIRTNYREHRRRAIPKTGFDKGAVEVDEARRLEAGTTQEMIGLDLQGKSSNQVVFPIAYNAVDMALYDTAVIRQELEMIWGIQEAMSSTIRVAKTATEADIQNEGTQSRLDYSRDQLDEMLGELARYDAEQATSEHGLSDDEARAIIGRTAMWIPVPDPETLESIVAIDIRAGSAGKPATALRQQQWSVLLPQLQQAAVQIGQMRGASPLDVANCLEQLAMETVKRAGDTSIDPYQFIPQPPAVAPVVPPVPGQPALPGAPVPGLAAPEPSIATALAGSPAAAPV